MKILKILKQLKLRTIAKEGNNFTASPNLARIIFENCETQRAGFAGATGRLQMPVGQIAFSGGRGRRRVMRGSWRD